MSFTRYHALTIAVVASMQQIAFAETTTYNIAAAPLSQTMAQIARQNSVTLSADPELLKGKSAPAIRGNHNVETAFNLALVGSGLQLIKNADGTVYSLAISKIEEKQKIRDFGQLTTIDVNANGSNPDNNAVQLPIITVNAETNTTEGTGSYTTGKMRTATKLDLSIRETPQSVTVITNQLIEDKKIDDFDTLMKNVTGVRVDKGIQDNRATYSLRGFNLDYYQMDGIPMPTNMYSMNNYNMDKFDRVEIVKGANGLTNGAGNPAGAINMIRKHANSSELTGDFDISTGTRNTYKLKADLSTPLNANGDIRGRLVASHKETDTFKDRVHNKNDLIYAVIDADISDTTLVSFTKIKASLQK